MKVKAKNGVLPTLVDSGTEQPALFSTIMKIQSIYMLS